MDEAQAIRIDFARAWGRMGVAWGVAPSTASVHAYALVHEGPMTEADVRRALGLSHKAAFTALAECEAWGLIAPADPRRSGARGPMSRAWVAVDDHWDWFHRVVDARKRREADPVLAILDECLRRAESGGYEELRDRVSSLLSFAHQFEHGLEAVVRADPAAIRHLFGVLNRMDDGTIDRLLATLASLPADELADGLTSLSRVRPGLLRRLLALVRQPGLGRLLR
jgi:DNA-binding transcriptional regulator GbsR (MarR family)